MNHDTSSFIMWIRWIYVLLNLIVWIRHTFATGLDMMLRFYDHHDHQITQRCIFFKCGNFKNMVYPDEVTASNELINRLHAACASVDTHPFRVQSWLPR
ncbi:hypothetical protein TNCV_1859531 [Trichonephila clavipes]|nr:hypothetical protein TNCV_1859531 [Trichonephila clavipes]